MIISLFRRTNLHFFPYFCGVNYTFDSKTLKNNIAMAKQVKPETLCVQAGWTPKKGEPRVLPIYQSTTFKYDTSEQMARLFDLEETGYFYTRLQNPTNEAVASKICALEGGVSSHANLKRSGRQLLRNFQYLSGRRPFRLLISDIWRYTQLV